MVALDSGAARRCELLEKQLDERLRRCVAAAEAAVLGPRGVSIVSRATGVSRQAIRRGLTELRESARGVTGRIRQPGGGRKRTRDNDPTLLRDLEQLVEPTTRGDPESPLRWTCKSVRQLATELQRQGHRVSHQLVSELLQELGYSLQANRKTIEGTSHPDRNAQFEYINRQVRACVRSGDPVISIDTNYVLSRIMDTTSGAACTSASADGPAAAHLIRDMYAQQKMLRRKRHVVVSRRSIHGHLSVAHVALRERPASE